jgi:hypothetical protein
MKSRLRYRLYTEDCRHCKAKAGYVCVDKTLGFHLQSPHVQPPRVGEEIPKCAQALSSGILNPGVGLADPK